MVLILDKVCSDGRVGRAIERILAQRLMLPTNTLKVVHDLLMFPFTSELDIL